MGSSSGLAACMDFSVGEEFEREVRRRFGVQVHHESPSPRGSFFLLATFCRFLFRLTEDSVSLALQSSLGGIASKFHMVELSHNHFRFSVSCKAVGFHVYALRISIGETFDVYFHLWNNGVPHLERDKRLWEEEEAKKWTLVLSKCQKRNAKSQSTNASAKKVRFAPKLVLASPVKKFAPPTPRVQLISFGEFKTSVDIYDSSFEPFTVLPPENGRALHNSAQFNSVQLEFDSDLSEDRPVQKTARPPSLDSSFIKSALKKDIFSANLISGSVPAADNYEQSNKAEDRGISRFNSAQCSNCLRQGHLSRDCRFIVHCLKCFNYGHRAKHCFFKPRRRLCWRPKSPMLGYTESSNTLCWKPKYPIPGDGNPHPVHGAPLAGSPDNFQNSMHDNVGAGEQALGDLGINCNRCRTSTSRSTPLVMVLLIRTMVWKWTKMLKMMIRWRWMWWSRILLHSISQAVLLTILGRLALTLIFRWKKFLLEFRTVVGPRPPMTRVL
jgi:hypothetical protein